MNSLPPRKADRQWRRRRRLDSAKSSGGEGHQGSRLPIPLPGSRHGRLARLAVALAGDTIAQLTERRRKSKAIAIVEDSGAEPLLLPVLVVDVHLQIGKEIQGIGDFLGGQTEFQRENSNLRLAFSRLPKEIQQQNARIKKKKKSFLGRHGDDGGGSGLGSEVSAMAFRLEFFYACLVTEKMLERSTFLEFSFFFNII